ncbi:MAG: SurA N-terminal domain-containing protein [Ardenticatenaceae bacterium]|nr:SurA N-terminal domain-containing protein [Ardenticatenaceae bacterium]
MTRQVTLLGLTFLLLLTACGNKENNGVVVPTLAPTAAVATAVSPEAAITPPATLPAPATQAPTAVPPTPTPTAALAALVNGQPILLATYEQELARYEQAQSELGSAPDADYRRVVLNALIEKELILQAATREGIQITPDIVAAKVEELRNDAGGPDNFAAWLEANQYTEDEFTEAIARDMATEFMASRVTESVPFAVEQVHARYIQVDDPALAQTLHQQLQNGDDFALRAQQYSLDQVTAQAGGDLGFFTRWSLTVPEVAEAAFNLQSGELSDVIAVTDADTAQTTYFLVQTIERDEQRPLTSQMRYTLLTQTFLEWLDQQRANADITILVDA